jgi:hypothetical protein
MVMQVKKATFQRMGSGGKGRTENRWDVSVQDSLHHRKYILHTHCKYIKKSQQLTVRVTTDVPGDNAECCSVSQISI